MEDRVKQFLASGKLEEYVFGIIDPKDQAEVLRFIKKYPEVNKEYQVLQKQLEELSIRQSLKAPMGMKSQILESLPNKEIASASSNMHWAKYAAILGLITSLLLAWAWKNSNDNLIIEKEKYAALASDCEERTQEAESQKALIAFLNSEQTQRFDLKGNQLAPDFSARVFVNEVFGKAILTPENSITLPQNKCLQLWGDLKGEMIPIAVLDNLSGDDFDLEINPNFTSLNLTIEEKTADGKGQLHPDVSQLIASVVI